MHTLILHLCIFVLIKSLQAQNPAGFIGCYKDWTGNRILQGKSADLHLNNCADICKDFCKSYGYRYAGTELGFECFCGHDIRVRIPSTACCFLCSGNSDELCGGRYRISIYDMWLISSSSQTRMFTDTERRVGSKPEDQPYKSATIIALSVVLALLGIVTVVLAVVVIKNRRQQKNADQTRVYCEPDESGMTGTSPQLNSVPDINTPVQQNATKEQRSKPSTCNVTRKGNTPDMVNSAMKISDGTYVNNERAILSARTADVSYELLQHNQASASEYTTIDARKADVNYEMLDKNSVQHVQEDEYRKLHL